uniref:RIC1 C-terminal alpha solenoid region domain-containing protein n=1 Tax=Ananas comosus var. bracteatus TaxID=296719 RepID=A0A6V7PLD2_ANACO|nr:unnamed protein product [Ananas comosus var. bracteatus]
MLWHRQPQGRSPATAQGVAATATQSEEESGKGRLGVPAEPRRPILFCTIHSPFPLEVKNKKNNQLNQRYFLIMIWMYKLLVKRDKKEDALRLACLSTEKPHFSHCLEWLLFTVFDAEISRTAGAAKIEVGSKSFNHAVFVIFWLHFEQLFFVRTYVQNLI